MGKSGIGVIFDIAESLGWRVWEGEGDLSFEASSPAGEDFWFSICSTSDPKVAAERIFEVAQEFNEDEHILKVVGMKGSPSLRELADDAEKIHAMLKEFAKRRLRRSVPGKRAVRGENCIKDSGAADSRLALYCDSILNRNFLKGGRRDILVRSAWRQGMLSLN